MEWQEFERKFPQKLNEQQKEAVQSVEGPVLLLAVPGSGKTTVLVTRLGYMIYAKGIAPEKILTVTYTVAATEDMAARFASLFGTDMADRLTFKTINGICAGIIHTYGRKTGRTPFALLNDEKVIADTLAKIYQKTERTYATESDLQTVRTLITYIKNSMLTDAEIREMDKTADMKISAIYKEYNTWLREQKLMDYDDQMVYAYTMLQRFPELLRLYQDKFPYLCVDEAQDTSKIQHAIIALLASKTENLFMVGDEDQSIYGFRAAYPEALLSFEKNHPGAKVLLMEENFRSGAGIVKAADTFIQKNTLRHKKHMRAIKDGEEVVKEIAVKTRDDQYRYLAAVAENCAAARADRVGGRSDNGTADASHTVAVLYRDHECALPLIDLLERKEIPYRMRNAEISFFTHRTVLDVLNIMKLAMHPKDAETFLQVYYKINTYIRKEDALQIARISETQDISVWNAAVRYHGLSDYTMSSVQNTRMHMQQLLTERGDKAVKRILYYMGYQEYLERCGLKADKIEILRILGSREDSMAGLLQRLRELQDILTRKETDYSCNFILSTIHASKGLEYDTVYLMDVTDGILPAQMLKNPEKASGEERENYEEERRLFYVGATRAKSELYVFTTGKPHSFCKELLSHPVTCRVKRKGIPSTP
ncbi:MAG: ATP-dependent helicase [Clostridium sp.]|nr:ATP-dependent helicase [Clostridium sp.]